VIKLQHLSKAFWVLDAPGQVARNNIRCQTAAWLEGGYWLPAVYLACALGNIPRNKPLTTHGLVQSCWVAIAWLPGLLDCFGELGGGLNSSGLQ
jgi:hypothetical protein